MNDGIINVMIIEDNPIASQFLRDQIIQAGFRVESVYSSAEEALDVLGAACQPQIVLLDIGLPGIDGITAIPLIKQLCPSCEIIIQTVFEDSTTILKAIRAGISGYILKNSTPAEFEKAIRDVAAGGSQLSALVARKVLDSFSHNSVVAQVASYQFEKNHAPAFASLSERETTILSALIKGLSYKEIASNLGISTYTVNNHLRKVYEKLRVHSRSEAVALAMGIERAADP